MMGWLRTENGSARSHQQEDQNGSLPLAQALLLTLIAAFAPSPAAAAGLISIRSHVCPATYDAASVSLYDLAANCHDAGAGLAVTLAHDNTPVSNSVTNNDGQIDFSSFQAGEAEIDQTAPAGYYNRAFCAVYKDNDSSAHVYNEYQNPVKQLIHADENLDCDFFNVIAVPLAPTTLTVEKHNCPDGFDAKNADMYALAAGCTAGGTEGVTFTLAPSDGQTYPATTTAGGLAEWQNVAPGDLTITETMPSGIESARAFCMSLNTQLSEYPVDRSGSIKATALVGSNFYCLWFDIPPATVTVTVTKYDCPVSVLGDLTNVTKLSQACQPMAGVTLDLLGNTNGYNNSVKTGQTGGAAWTGVAPGDYSIEEEVPSGYDAPVVFCKIGSPGPAMQMPVSSAPVAITFTVTSGQTVDCIWFNIPLPPPTATATATATPPATATSVVIVNPPGNGTATPTPKTTTTAKLIIEKFTCKPGYDVFAKDADPKTDCTDTTANVAFALTGGVGPVAHKTGSDGKVSFANVKAGDYQIAETMPAGVTSAFIGGCDSTVRNFSDYPFTPFAVIGANGKLGINLQASETLDCRWYDVPEKQATSAAVKITVLDCPGQSVVLSQCTPAASGIEFSLTPSGGSGGKAITLKTDASGIAAGNAQAGTYQLAEVGSAWCLADSKAFDANAHLTVGSDAVNVSIYNCGG